MSEQSSNSSLVSEQRECVPHVVAVYCGPRSISSALIGRKISPSPGRFRARPRSKGQSHLRARLVLARLAPVKIERASAPTTTTPLKVGVGSHDRDGGGGASEDDVRRFPPLNRVLLVSTSHLK